MIEMPFIGLGTWKLYGDACIRVVKTALELGYRHIDTAFAYKNHKEIGSAIRGFDRQKIFITTKVSLGVDRGALGEAQIDRGNIYSSVLNSCDQALKELGIDYLDLMLIHWPDKSWPLAEVFAALQKIIDAGKLRYSGASNFTEHHLEDVYVAGYPVSFLQAEFHPLLNQQKLRAFCAEHGTSFVGHRPFGKGKLCSDEPLFGLIGEKYGRSANQIILRWTFQQGVPTLPKASSASHLQENLSIFDFELSEEDMDQINSLNKGVRYCDTSWNEFNY